MSTAQTVNLHGAVPENAENIHTSPAKEIGISWGLGSGESVRPKNLRKFMKLSWNFQRRGWGT